VVAAGSEEPDGDLQDLVAAGAASCRRSRRYLLIGGHS
jgi:hypothetical protein